MDNDDGFRPPHFSEDLAWLPGWLQQNQIEQSDQCVNKLKGTNIEPAPQSFEVFRGNSSRGNYANILSREEDRNKSYHLLLSGEDSSPGGFASSPRNVLHFQLRLSSSGYSQCSPTEPSDASKNDLKSDRVANVDLSEISVSPKVQTCSHLDINHCGRKVRHINSIQKLKEDVGPHCSSHDKISDVHFGEKVNVRSLKAADITAAVELSIAASEALVIHDIVRSDLADDTLPTAMVLEASLRVKKARLEWSHDALDSIAEETDRSDSLSDLDDVMMTDVFEDVGLSCSIPFDDSACCSDISLVNETPLSELQCVKLSDPADLGALQVKFDYISAQRHLEENSNMDIPNHNVPSQPSNHEREEFDDYAVMGSNIYGVAGYNHSALKNSDNLAIKQRVCPSLVDRTSYQPQNKVDIHPHAWTGKSNRATYIVSNKFSSRWLGGWTGQEASAVGHLRQKNKSIMKCYTAETSFLSESEHMAPDLNSFVKVHETELHRESQSSIHLDRLPHETTRGLLFSQDVVISSSLSLVDPLCSVVPCSIPSENEAPMLMETQRDKDSDTGKCSSWAELGMGSSYKSPNLIINIHQKDGQTTPLINDEDSPVSVRRHFLSLKTYSTFPLNPVPIVDGASLYHNQSLKLDCDQRLITVDPNGGCIRYGDKSGKWRRPFKAVSVHYPITFNKDNSKSISMKRKYHETGGDQIGPVQPSKKRRRYISFKHRAHRLLHASKLSVNSTTLEKHSTLALVTKNVVELQEDEELQNASSACKTLQCKDVPVRKKVHFSETEIPVQRNKNLKKLDSSTKHWSTDRASNMPEYQFQNHKKSCLKNCHIKAGKTLLFQGIQFLLTGFSRGKEKVIEEQIWKHGGIVLYDIPPPNSRKTKSLSSNVYQLPIILCPKKLQTTKFLYGCAVNAFILKEDWLTNSISADYIVPHEQYNILPNRANAVDISIGKPLCHEHKYVFDRVGIMLHGNRSLCCKLAKIVKHGGGQVFKTLQRLILQLEQDKVSWGAIVSEDKRTSRHLRHCAAEQKIPIVPTSWIIESLHLGKRLPISDTCLSSIPLLKIAES